MSAVLMLILQWLSPHHFSWPHSGIHGLNHQVCLLCGMAFECDVTGSRHKKRVALPTGAMSRQPLTYLVADSLRGRLASLFRARA
jgi:hypothetical protein